MKKAKIFLTAIGIFAVVGGALAFKASRQNPSLFYCTTVNSALTCVLGTYHTTGQIAVPTSTLFTGPGTFCSTILDTNGCNRVHPVQAFTNP